MNERRANWKTREKFEWLRQNLTQRLKNVCAHMDGREFDCLTAQMTRIRVKYDAVTAVPESDDGYGMSS